MPKPLLVALLHKNVAEVTITHTYTHTQLTKLAKRLKKEKVSVDIVNFGEEVSETGYMFATSQVSKLHMGMRWQVIVRSR